MCRVRPSHAYLLENSCLLTSLGNNVHGCEGEKRWTRHHESGQGLESQAGPVSMILMLTHWPTVGDLPRLRGWQRPQSLRLSTVRAVPPRTQQPCRPHRQIRSEGVWKAMALSDDTENRLVQSLLTASQHGYQSTSDQIQVWKPRRGELGARWPQCRDIFSK
jgi:hypothetical protein